MITGKDCKYYYPDGALKSHSIYHGLLIYEQIYYLPTGELDDDIGHRIIEWDEDRMRRTKITCFNADGSIKEYTVYEYNDSTRQPYKITTYDADGNVIDSFTR